MSSTNKTTNYELSQFVGSDKPAWLSDYNQDMAKIDAGIDTAQDTATGADGKADTANNHIGDMTYLSTTAKNTLVAAVNEVDSNADTAQTTANTAATNANQALTTANSISDYLNVGANNTVITASSMSLTGVGSIRASSNIHIVGNTDNSLIKIYGNVFVDNSSPSSPVTITISGTGITPDTNLTINSCGIVTKETTSGVVYVDPLTYNINSDGTITFTMQGTGSISILGAKFIACLVFVKNFGD